MPSRRRGDTLPFADFYTIFKLNFYTIFKKYYTIFKI